MSSHTNYHVLDKNIVAKSKLSHYSHNKKSNPIKI